MGGSGLKYDPTNVIYFHFTEDSLEEHRNSIVIVKHPILFSKMCGISKDSNFTSNTLDWALLCQKF